MPTNVPIGSALARKLYSVACFATTQRLPSFRGNMTGPAPKQKGAEAKLKGQTSPEYPFVRITDLAKQRGETVSVDLFDITQGKPTMGDRKLSGKGMSLDYDSMDLRIDQYRGMLDPGGRMTQQRTVHNLRGIAMANLSGWANRLEDQLCLIHAAGGRGEDNGADWNVPLVGDADFDDIVVNALMPPTTNRLMYAGDATAHSDMDSADKLLLGTFDKFRVIMDELVHPMQPIKLRDAKGNMDPQAEEDPLFVAYLTARQWYYLQTSTSDPAWRTFLANAHARSDGFNHPLFKGTRGMWQGILFKKLNRSVRWASGSSIPNYAGNVTANTDVDRCIVLGAQAVAEAYGRHSKSDFHYNWHEEETDHGNTVEISVAMIGGKKKLRFSIDGTPTDHGVYCIDSYGGAIT